MALENADADFDADIESNIDTDDAVETKVQRPNGTGEGGVERRKVDKGIFLTNFQMSTF